MKINKKFRLISVTLIIEIIISFASISYFADSSPLIVGDSVTVAKGIKEVAISVRIKNNPGVASVALDVTFDKTALSLKGLKYNEEATRGAATVPFNPSASPTCLSIVNGSEEITGDFSLATLYFDISDAPTGVYDICFGYNKENIYNINEENIEFIVINGRISISDSIEPTIDCTEPSKTVNEIETIDKKLPQDISHKSNQNIFDKTLTNQLTVQTAKSNTKKINTIKVRLKTKRIKLRKLKKASQRLCKITVKKAKGKVKYMLIKCGTAKKIRKRVKINSKGVVIINKWAKAKKGTYKLKIKVIALGNAKYKAKSIAKKTKIKII